MDLFKSTLALAGLITLSACTVETTLSGANQALNDEAKALYQDVIQSRDAEVMARLSPDADAASIQAQLPLYRTIAGTATPPEPTVTASANSKGTEGQRYSVSHSYAYTDRLISTTTRFTKVGEDWKVQGLDLQGQMKPQAASPAV